MKNKRSDGTDNHIRRDSGDVSWYTPPTIIELARAVMGKISLDPASCVEANEIVRAERYFTVDDDGLSRSWEAETVFCNPPYGKGNAVGKWWDKMKREYEAGLFIEGMFLTHATTETKWMQDALSCFPVLLISKRLSFWKPEFTPDSGDVRLSRSGYMGSALVYLPPLDGPLEVPLGSPLTPPLYSPGLSPADLYSSALARFAAVAGDYGTVITAI